MKRTVPPDENMGGFGFEFSGSSLAAATEENTQKIRKTGKTKGFILSNIWVTKCYGFKKLTPIRQARYLIQINNFP
jgi:hypothetical protein